MVREFALVNEKGERYSLMDIKNNCLLTDPAGLGYSYDIEYQQVKNVFIENLKKLEQGQITGNINFLNYDNYYNFSNFIARSQKLKFSYKIPFINLNSIEFFKDVNTRILTKTEKKTNGTITENIVFDCLSLWYEQNETVFKIETYEDEMRYPYMWSSRYIDYSTRTITFNNKGHVEAPIKVEIEGFVKNPTISIFLNKEEYASIKVPITINEYEKLLYSSKTGEIYIQKQKTDGTKESLWKQEYIDITKQNIFRLPVRSFGNKFNGR